MSLGGGILWSTVLLLLAAGVYQISIRKKWKLVSKAVGVLLLIGVVIGGAVWGWYWYQGRPYVVEELAGIRLGMTAVEVRLAKGAANLTSEPEKAEDADSISMWMSYGGGVLGDQSLFVIFRGESADDLRVWSICKSGGYDNLLGLSEYSSEYDVVKKLGEPTKTSIRYDGLSKYISYEQWRVTYQITKGDVSRLCISESGEITFAEEYGDESRESTE